MHNIFSVQQKSQTGNLDSNLILRQYKLNLMAKLMEIKSINPKKTQDQIAKELGCSRSNLQRYRQDINMLSPHKYPPNNTNKGIQKISNTNLDDKSHRERDVKRPRVTSIDLNSTQPNPEKCSPETVKPKKNKQKRGSNIEINGKYLDEILHNNNL